MNKLFTTTLALALLAGCQDKASNTGLSDLIRSKSGSIVTVKGRTFRDLNHNGRLDVYEDVSQPTATRVADLLGQMNLEEKAGMMFINGAPVSEDGLPDGKIGLTGPGARMPSVVENMNSRKMAHFNIWDIPADPAVFAKWYNSTQQIAEKTRLGIPVTIASDPRHHFSKNIFSMSAKGFSQFCETLGLAALSPFRVSERANLPRKQFQLSPDPI